MSNPFSGIITTTLKTLHKNMIDSLLEDSALTVRCVITYIGTKFTECPNCTFSVLGGKSINRYKQGGQYPFSNGNCPHCGGSGRLQSSSTEEIYLMPIWDSKSWILTNPNLNTADITLQTMSKITTLAKIKKATKIVIDSALSGYGQYEYVRVGEPEPIAFGSSNHIITSWKRA